jgi:hypothetical protein
VILSTKKLKKANGGYGECDDGITEPKGTRALAYTSSSSVVGPGSKQ